MKILIVTHGFLPDVDGGIIVIYNYACQLVQLGHDVTVLSKHYDKKIDNDGFKHLMLSSKYNDRQYLKAYKSFFANYSLDSYDKILLNQYPTAIAAGKLFTTSTLKKCIPIIQGHEVEVIYKNKSFPSRLYNNWIRRAKKYHVECFRACNKIVSVSAAHRDKVIKAAGIEELRSKFHVVHTGVDRSLFKYTESDFRKRLSIEGKQLLVTVSRVVKEKGFEEMISIFKQLSLVDDSFVWVIAGDGEFMPDLKARINSLSLQDKIILLGKCEQTQLAEIYSAADCFWLLSNYDECLPLVYLEAQACATPSIGRKKGGVVETIQDGETGFLVESEEECLELLSKRAYNAINLNSLSDFVSTFDTVKATQELIQ